MLRRNMIMGIAVGCFWSASIIVTAQDCFRKSAKKRNDPSYPIAADVTTTLDKTVSPLPHGAKLLLPRQVSEYAPNQYGEWQDGSGFPFLKPQMKIDTQWPNGTDSSLSVPSTPDPSGTKLLSFFTMSDIHITDKESPAQVPYYGYELGPLANSSAYSAVFLYTTHVLDAAIQTINAIHKKDPFDFGIALGDACNNSQYNELRWYLDVIDGKKITPGSGAHLGAKTIDYQKPYQAAGLDKSINWYQVIGNHDQFWLGSALADDYVRKIVVSSRVLNLGDTTPGQIGQLSTRGFYMGVVDGSTKYGDIINAGPQDYFEKPPKVAADSKRRMLSIREWMKEFFKTTSFPVGHGFTEEMIKEGFACYSFYPKAGVPIKVIAFDDTDKAGSAAVSLDYRRYNWLISELDAGEAAGELMIVCAHIPIRPYTNIPAQSSSSPQMTTFASYSTISESTLLNKLWTYKNLVLWISGHVHRNTITPQPSPDGNPETCFWEVETPSLRDLPQQFRRFEIVLNSNNTISIFTCGVDPALNLTPLPNGESSPALTSRSYAIATQQIFNGQMPPNNQVQQGPNVDPVSGVYNAELVKQISPEMQAKLANVLSLP